MSPYCVLGWDEEHIEGECTLPSRQVQEDEPLGITPATERTRAAKEDNRIADVKSTGRKRAVQVKPITGQDCEWKGLKYAGGGIFPVMGCINSKAEAVHHGYNKSTLDNRLSNLHAICAVCHNKWHVLNDPTYPEENIGSDWYPVGVAKEHDKDTKFTPEEFISNELWWKTPKGERT